MSSSNKYWLALSKVPKVGESTLKKLYDHFGSGEAVWNAKERDFSEIEGITRIQVGSILRAHKEIDPERELELASEFDFITFDDPLYPEKLKNTYDPPPVLYYRGLVETLSKKAIAIVGTRKPTSYGAEMAGKFARELSSLGFVIVSGMAFGVDTAAHKGALDAHGETVAVFGCGINTIYPAENIRLAEAIANSGCLISEFPPGTPTSNWTFPQRNRIISGISIGVIVIEGAMDSGSLITAKMALEQGREVFAVPGQIENENSRGPHWLIKQGAKLVDSIEDIFEELNIPLPEGHVQGSHHQRDLSCLSDAERDICEELRLEPLHIDRISERSGLPVQEVSGMLMMLEIKGYIRQISGKVFVLK